MHYTEQNPVRAGLVRHAWTYAWFSAAAHISGDDKAGLLNMSYWRQVLEKAQDEDVIEHIRRNTHTGRPLAGDAFISKLKKLLNKRLRPPPIGRPK